LNVVLDPLKGEVLVKQAPVAAYDVITGREEAQRAQAILDDEDDDVMQNEKLKRREHSRTASIEAPAMDVDDHGFVGRTYMYIININDKI
jgi:hypothetical protein